MAQNRPGTAKMMRLNLLIPVGLVLLGLSSRAGAIYLDPADDYTNLAGTNNNEISPDIESVSGVYDETSASYVFTVKFYNDTISLPFSPPPSDGQTDTQITGYLEFALGNGTPSAESFADQYYQIATGAQPYSYSPMPRSDFYFGLGQTSYDSATHTDSGYVRTTSGNAPVGGAGTAMGTLALSPSDSRAFVISVPIAALGLSRPVDNLAYSFVAVSDYGDVVDFAPNGGGPYLVTVPEASSLTLLSLGGAGLAAGFWRRRRRAA
jgi:hypothetical protein